MKKMALVYTSTNATNENLFYVFGHANGFVLIAAEDRIQPILGNMPEQAVYSITNIQILPIY
jgi:hypothetical protein